MSSMSMLSGRVALPDAVASTADAVGGRGQGDVVVVATTSMERKQRPSYH